MTMTTATLSADDVVYAIDKNVPPRLRVSAPAEVTIATLDARAGRLTRPEEVESTAPDYRDRFPRANPATGPIFVEGAEPCGDVPRVERGEVGGGGSGQGGRHGSSSAYGRRRRDVSSAEDAARLAAWQVRTRR